MESIGLLAMVLAAHLTIALAGAALIGFGYSLVFPGFGTAVVKAAPPESRGMAMGLYSACLDVALALSGSTLGFLGDVAGLPAMFVTSARLVSMSTIVAVSIMSRA